MGLNAQVEELRAAEAALSTEVDAAIQRVLDLIATMQTKIESLGEVDPDLQSDIDAAKADLEKVKGIAPASEPSVTPTEPA